MDLIKILYYIGIITISFDNFLVFDFGFNFRITQFAMIIPILFILTLSLKKKKISLPVGFIFLVLWNLFMFMFIPNTAYVTRSVGYALWLLYNTILVYITIIIFNNEENIVKLTKVYINTYVFVSLFGIIQFVLPVFFGIYPPLQEEGFWWIPGLLPRVHGFSYEPSYYATYLLIGWIMVAYLLETKTYNFISYRKLQIYFLIISLGIILSTSRMGWLMILLWFLRYPIMLLWRFFTTKSIIVYKFKTLVMILLFIFCLSVFGVNQADNLLFLLEGIGIAGTTSHSSDTRLSELEDTLEVFVKSPLIGYSLGGVSVAIADIRGQSITSLDDVKQSEGMSVFAEVLAASGIVGMIPFIIYLASIIYFPFKLSYRLSLGKKHIIQAFVYALLFEFIILQFNQNILRPYLWLHIALLSAVYHVYKKEDTVNLK